MKSTKYIRFRHPLQSQHSNSFSLIQLLVLLFTCVWLLAVVKVFLLEKSRIDFVDISPILPNFADDTVKIPISSDQNSITYKSKFDSLPLSVANSVNEDSIPRFSDWSILRAPISKFTEPRNRPPRPEFKQAKAPLLPEPPKESDLKPSIVVDIIPGSAKVASAEQESVTTGKDHLAVHDWVHASKLKWPPVSPDGTLSEEEGYEVMALTGLKVPRFWAPPSDVNPNDITSEVAGNPTIFLMIASYRDFQCRETIAGAFERADHPDRLFVGAVDQVVDGDTGCLDIEVPCSKNPNQMICKYWDHISVFKMDAKLATGPVTARHIGYRLYRGQHFFMQMDAHCQFVRHWDTLIIEQWKLTGNEMAVLSSYLTDVQGSIDKNGDSTRTTRPIMCNSDFEGQMPARYIRHQAQPEEEPAITDMPQMQPYWAAGFSFSRGHFIVRVPYDAYQSMVFQGEEISIGVRGFTFGYDFYAPRDSVVFHEYASLSSRRKKIPMFWENSDAHKGAGFKALKRSTSIIHLAPDIDPSEWDHSEESRYGLGTVRTPELFYKLFLIDTTNRLTTQLCPFVKTGKMHTYFQPFLRLDGYGIDYSYLENFDTRTSIRSAFKSKRAYGEELLLAAIASKERKDLHMAINNAIRIGLSQTNPNLILAQNLVNTLG